MDIYRNKHIKPLNSFEIIKYIKTLHIILTFYAAAKSLSQRFLFFFGCLLIQTTAKANHTAGSEKDSDIVNSTVKYKNSEGLNISGCDVMVKAWTLSFDNVKHTCVVLIALGGLTQQLGDSRAHSLCAGTQILGAFLQLNKPQGDRSRAKR